MTPLAAGIKSGAGYSGLILLAGLAAAVIVPARAAEAPAAPTSGPTPSSPASRAALVCDAECVRINADRAVQSCASVIEGQAPIDYDWMHRPAPGIFEEAEQPTAASSVARYRGDLIRFQTAQKDWVRMSYECGYDVGAKKVVFINMHPGRLNLPKPAVSATVVLPQDPAPQRAAILAQPIPPKGGTVLASAPQASSATRKPPSVGEPSPIAIEQQAPRVRP